MRFNKPAIKILLLLLLALLTKQVYAHNINFAMEEAPVEQVAWFYLKLGIVHIIPFGLDHILFVASLCFLNQQFKSILWQATAFTAAHSITLAISAKGIISLPAAVVEPIIALSIMFVAIENMVLHELKPWRIVMVFLFGLIHGLGFASVLNETGLPRNQFFISLLSFNIGVEVGQLIVIAIIFWLMVFPFRQKSRYKKLIVYPFSLFIALVAAYWTAERIFG